MYVPWHTTYIILWKLHICITTDAYPFVGAFDSKFETEIECEIMQIAEIHLASRSKFIKFASDHDV